MAGVAAAYEASDHLGHACQYKAVPSLPSQVGSYAYGLGAISAACMSNQGRDPEEALHSLCGRAAKGGILRQPQWRQRQRGQELRLGTAHLTRGGVVPDV